MRLKPLRKDRNLTQKAVAASIGCSVNTYSRYERGDRQPDIATLKLLSKYFGVTIDYIVGNDIFLEEV
jgi:transcriptional regulator with XRE-family HTH domain